MRSAPYLMHERLKAEEAPPIQVYISNVSLPYRVQLLGSVASYERYVDATGADGMEVTPGHSRFFRRVLQWTQARLAEPGEPPLNPYPHPHPIVPSIAIDATLDWTPLFSTDWTYEAEVFNKLIKSGHSSFREEAKDDGAAALFFPKWPKSLSQLEKIQQALGRSLPVVLYPNFNGGQVRYNKAPFAERSCQPKAKDWKVWGLKENAAPYEVWSTLGDHGFTDITWDGAHAQGFVDPLVLCQQLAASRLIRSQHLALGRTDQKKILGAAFVERSKQARKAFIQSSERAEVTLEGEMLLEIVRHWKRFKIPGRIVLEEMPQPNAEKALREQAAIIQTVRSMIRFAR